MDKLNKIKQLAIANQAILISDTVKSPNEYYLFEDLEGKTFKIREEYLRKRGWPKNLQAYLSRSEKMQKSHEDFLNEMMDIAKANGGELLSNEWKGVNYLYDFILNDKKILTRSYLTLVRHGWFNRNYVINSKTIKEKYEKLKDFAKKNGGKLLSKKWLGYKIKHEFMDADGIIFSASPERLYRGQWGIYSGLVAEPICRQIFEYIFCFSFNKTRNILIPTLTGRKKSLELDGYCKELNIAFEYQGHPSHWDNKHKNYTRVVKNDCIKSELCKKLKIKLVTIPVFPKGFFKLDSSEIFNFVLDAIESSCLKNEVNNYIKKDVDFIIDYMNISHGKKMIKELGEKIKNLGGKLLSKEWHGTEYIYEFEWNDGRKFFMPYDKFRINGWPKNLDNYLSWSNGHKKTPEELLAELELVAKNHKYKLITQKWLGNNRQYEFETEDKIRFFITAQSMKKRKLEQEKIVKKSIIIKSETKKENSEYYLNKMHQIAQQNNCHLLSTEWKGNKHRYLFEYSDGEQFTATYIYLKVKKFKQVNV